MYQYLLLAFGTVTGLFWAYLNASPNWDDTAILLVGILLSSSLFELLGFRRPWLMALAVGVWVPLYEILWNHTYAPSVALVFALLGAYLGWGVHRLLRKISQTI